MTDLDLDELRSELDDFAEPEKKGGRSPRDERIIAGFEEIQRFVEQHGRAPVHGEDRDIFERLYAVRLDRLRNLAECRSLLDTARLPGTSNRSGACPPRQASKPSMRTSCLPNLVAQQAHPISPNFVMSAPAQTSARPRKSLIVRRCEDFDRFKPLFQQIQKEIESGVRETRPFELKAEIGPGSWFIVGGQKAYVARDGRRIYKCPRPH